MLPNKFWNEIAKRKERLRRATTQLQKEAAAADGLPGTPRAAAIKKRTIIDLHSPMRQRSIAEKKKNVQRRRAEKVV